jgi:integrase
MTHLRTTLRAALNLAVREGVLETNPARHIEIPGYRKPHAQVWTDGRVQEWQRTGHRQSAARPPPPPGRTARQTAGRREGVWHESRYVFVRKDGSPIHPGYASCRFHLLVAQTGVPPIRLHDLRHGAASLAHQAGADLKTLRA